jgi:hypothetical protein
MTEKMPLLSIAEENVGYKYSWNDFDHTKSLFLTFRKSHNGAESDDIDKTRIVYEVSRDEKQRLLGRHVLQWCLKSDFDSYRTELLRIAEENRHFVNYNLAFPHQDRYYVGSQLAYVCLADVIASSIPIGEEEAVAILTQVSRLHLPSNEN